MLLVLTMNLDERAAESPGYLDGDSEPDEDGEGREYLYPVVLQDEVGIRDAGRCERRHGEVEAINKLPTVVERVDDGATHDQDDTGTEHRGEVLLLKGMAQRPP